MDVKHEELMGFAKSQVIREINRISVSDLEFGARLTRSRARRRTSKRIRRLLSESLSRLMLIVCVFTPCAALLSKVCAQACLPLLMPKWSRRPTRSRHLAGPPGRKSTGKGRRALARQTGSQQIVWSQCIGKKGFGLQAVHSYWWSGARERHRGWRG